MPNNSEGSKVIKKGVTQAAKKVTDNLDAKITSDIKMLENTIKDLERRIIRLVNDLRTSDLDLLIGPRVNLKQAQAIHTKLSQLFKDLYGKEVRRQVRGYKDVENWILENFNSLGVAAEWTTVDLDMIKQLKNQTLTEFLNLSATAETRITQALYNSIAAQAPVDSLIDTISAALTGTLSKSGRPLSTYASLYANDMVMNFYNNLHIEKGRSLGMRWLLYSGTIMARSRDFCRVRANKVYSIAQVNSWTHSWKGKSGPALTNRGGWNCRHHWQPVRKSWIE